MGSPLPPRRRLLPGAGTRLKAAPGVVVAAGRGKDGNSGGPAASTRPWPATAALPCCGSPPPRRASRRPPPPPPSPPRPAAGAGCGRGCGRRWWWGCWPPWSPGCGTVTGEARREAARGPRRRGAKRRRPQVPGGVVRGVRCVWVCPSLQARAWFAAAGLICLV